MRMTADVSITRSKQGYYVLTIGGEFQGTYDTAHEAALEAEELLNSEMTGTDQKERA